MAYLGSLEQCVSTLEQCNNNLHSMTNSLSGLTRTFPRVGTVIRCTKKYDLTTASDIGKAQDLISKEAVPFLFRQVDQLETAIEAIRSAHETLGQRVEDQRAEHEQLTRDDAALAELQRALKAEQAALADEQTNLLNAKSQVAAKERDLAELHRARSATRHTGGVLEEAARVDAEIIRVRRMLADVEHETACVPTDDQIRTDDDGSDMHVVLDGLRAQLELVTDSPVDADLSAFVGRAGGILELLENKVFVPWWDAGSGVQAVRSGYIGRLLRYFYKDHGATMQAIIDVLQDTQPITVDDMRRELAATGQATSDLPLIIGHLKTIGAITSDTTTVAGKQVMSLQLDFSGLTDEGNGCEDDNGNGDAHIA
ncbi:hypothetical protein IWW50_002424 [Coemansia erecta]|nr:hypothetical protein IWW50_002424 [Coemansia erecta]